MATDYLAVRVSILVIWILDLISQQYATIRGVRLLSLFIWSPTSSWLLPYCVFFPIPLLLYSPQLFHNIDITHVDQSEAVNT